MPPVRCEQRPILRQSHAGRYRKTRRSRVRGWLPRTTATCAERDIAPPRHGARRVLRDFHDDAEHHTSVRRLHVAGASRREVAQALGISYQRVQQIVEGARGTWWQRIRRTRSVSRDAVCTYCDRPPSEVVKLVAGPNVFIFDRCIGRMEATVGGSMTDARRNASVLGKRATKARCSFCGKAGDGERAVVVSKAASACSECLAICRRIIDDRVA